MVNGVLILKIKSVYKILEIDDIFTVCDEQGIPLKNGIVLDEISLFLWKLIKEKEIAKSNILGEVLKNFEISTVLALGEIDRFVRIMKENGILEE